jgi:hypothetical protein
MLDRHQTFRLALIATMACVSIIGGAHAWFTIITDLMGG